MKILVTGSKGFIGKNLIAELKNYGYNDIYEYDIDSTLEELDKFCKEASFIFHLAGINRPLDVKDFETGNYGFTTTLLGMLKKHNNKSPIMLSSSIQAEIDNPYGISKKQGEDALFKFGRENKSKVYVYRLPNVFGKWCKPNYNSVVATFSHNIANDIPITINDKEANLNLVYIDDLVCDLITLLENKQDSGYINVTTTYNVRLGELADLIYSFKNSRIDGFIPDMGNSFTKKLYSSYLTYLPNNNFSYELKMNIDNRGSFTEFIKTVDRGQVSVNISKPGITKGNHWHHSKNEKFLVVSGKGVIRFRKYNEKEIIKYFVSSEKLEVIDIPPGYTHNIENLGNIDMVTIMWVNEPFDPNIPDTYFEEV